MGYVADENQEQGIPLELEDELRKNPKALGIFWGLSPSHKLEYIEWLNKSRTAKTRQSRAQKAVRMMLEEK